MEPEDKKLLIGYIIGFTEVGIGFAMAFTLDRFGGYSFIVGGILLFVLRFFIPDGFPETSWLWSSDVLRSRTLQGAIIFVAVGLLSLILHRF